MRTKSALRPFDFPQADKMLSLALSMEKRLERVAKAIQGKNISEEQMQKYIALQDQIDQYLSKSEEVLNHMFDEVGVKKRTLQIKKEGDNS